MGLFSFLSPPKPPKATDPQEIIAASRYNQATPFGGQTWTPPAEKGGQWGVSSTLSPAQQQQLGALEPLNLSGTGLAQGRLNALPSTGLVQNGNVNVPSLSVANGPPLPWMLGGGGVSSGTWTGGGGAGGVGGGPSALNLSQQVAPQPVSANGLPGVTSSLDLASLPGIPADRQASVAQTRDALFNSRKQLLDPEFAKQDRRFNQDMANAGLPMGSEAYTDTMNTVKDRQNLALSQAAADAVAAGGAEDSRIFGQQQALRTGALGEQTANANLGIAARGLLGNEAMGMANQNFNQQLGTRKQYADEALQLANNATQRDLAAMNASSANTNAAFGANSANYRAGLDYALQQQKLGLEASNTDWNQAMQAWQLSRGGLMQPNFQNSAGDSGGAYSTAQNAANANYAAQAGQYGANMGALGTLGAATMPYLLKNPAQQTAEQTIGVDSMPWMYG